MLLASRFLQNLTHWRATAVLAGVNNLIALSAIQKPQAALTNFRVAEMQRTYSALLTTASLPHSVWRGYVHILRFQPEGIWRAHHGYVGKPSVAGRHAEPDRSGQRLDDDVPCLGAFPDLQSHRAKLRRSAFGRHWPDLVQPGLEQGDVCRRSRRGRTHVSVSRPEGCPDFP